MEKKYFEIYQAIKDGILSGEYPAGSKLPSKRSVAERRGCSVITVETAYGMLLEEGYIRSRERSGYFVEKFDAVKRVGAPSFKREVVELPTAISEPDFEYSLWFKAIRKVLMEKGKELFVKAPVKGCAVLRNAIADYLFRYRGMLADPNRIIIGSGAEQLYETIVKILGRDKTFAIEKPCYEKIKSVYKSEAVSIAELTMGVDGIESDALASKDFNVLHVTPFTSYPSGVTASVVKRHEYLKWASENDGYIVEDDYASEFFTLRPIDTLYSLGGDRVIYINTFSKSISPSLRIGYMILPKELLSSYEKTAGGYSCSVPVLDQYVLAEFINSGGFERHLNRVRRRLKKDRKND